MDQEWLHNENRLDNIKAVRWGDYRCDIVHRRIWPCGQNHRAISRAGWRAPIRATLDVSVFYAWSPQASGETIERRRSPAVPELARTWRQLPAAALSADALAYVYLDERARPVHDDCQ